MPLKSSYGTGRYLAGDADVLITPSRWLGDTTRRGVLFIHGANDSALQGWAAQTKPKTTALIAAIAEAGYPVLSIDAASTGTANKWANDTAMSAVDAAWSYLKTTVGVRSDKVHLIGFSMGALTALVWASRNKTLTASIAGICPVADLTDFRDANRGGYQANVDAAYTNGYTEGTYGAARNPKTIATAGGLAGVPGRLWYASDDAIAIPSTATALATAWGVTATSVGAQGHTDAAVGIVNAPDLLALLTSVV